MTDADAEREPYPQFSIGFPFDNPLGDIESEPPADPTTIGLLSLLVGIVPSYAAVKHYTPDSQGRQNTIMLKDGMILQETLVTNGQVEERSFRFLVNDLDRSSEAYYCFEVVLDELFGTAEVADFGVIDGRVLTDEEEMVREAIMLNMSARLAATPDTIPVPIEDGTLRADADFAEQHDAFSKAYEEIANDVPILSDGPEPIRTTPLSEPFAKKLLEVLEPIVFTRLGAEPPHS